MLREFAWKSFEYTGDIDYYMFYKEVETKNRTAIEKNVAKEEAAITG